MALPARPRIMAVLPGFIPSTMITVVKPLLSLHRAGRIAAKIVLEGQAALGDVAWADGIVFCRNTQPRHAPLLAAAQARGTPMIYDLDDNLFELPPDCEGLTGMREPSRRAMLEEYLRAASLVRVYSQPLADRAAALNPRVALSFAPVDLSLLPPEREPVPAGPIKIVYATSRTQDALCEIFRPALERIMGSYAGRVEVHYWGCRPARTAPQSGIRHHGLICHYDRFLRRFSRGGYDIGLAPMPDDIFYRSKTNNKFREYGASGIAGIYSRDSVYANSVEHEVTGLLVANEERAWHDAIARLIEDDALRMRIQRQARRYVSDNYAQAKFEELFLAQIHSVLGTPAGPARAAAETHSRIPGFFRRIREQAGRSMRTLRRLRPEQAWTALRWSINDRCYAAWLRWQLWQ
jgi:hypothetical protein